MSKVVMMMVAALLAANVANGQDVRIPREIDRLADKAVNTVNVTVDGSLLQLASKFLSSVDDEQQIVKKLIANLKGIYVRSYEFANAGEYSGTDVDALRLQFKSPAWSKVVGVRSARGGEDVDVFLKMEKDRIAGLVVIAAQARQLTFVNIDGPIDIDQLSTLGGQFGIPKLDVARPRK